MRVGPRAALALAVAGGFGSALAPWWTLTWTGPVGGGSADLAGADGTGGVAQVLAVAAAGGLLLTLGLGPLGRRVAGVLTGFLAAGMVALGVGAHGADAAGLVARVPAAMVATDTVARPTPWPAAYAACALAGVAASGWLVVRPGEPRRADGTAAQVADPLASWKAMDDGRDPTRDTEDEEST